MLKRYLFVGVAILMRCPYYVGVHTIKVSILIRCPFYRGFFIIEVFGIL